MGITVRIIKLFKFKGFIMIKKWSILKLGFTIFITMLYLNCHFSSKETKKLDSLPDSLPLKPGNAWIYKHIRYIPYGLTLSVEYDTINIIGKYQDYYKRVTNCGRIVLVNNKNNKYITYGYIQPADTIHGRIRDKDSIKYSQARIFKQDTFLLDKPVVTAIFNSDTGYIPEDSLSANYTFSEHRDSFHITIQENFEYMGDSQPVYIISYSSQCPAVSKRYNYYGKQGLLYYKAVGNYKDIIVEEKFLVDTLHDFYLKNMKVSNSKKYF